MLRCRPDGVRVAVRLSAGARADRVLGILATGEAPLVAASVTARRERGRANEALLLLLARVWQVPRRDLAIVAGVTSRRKIVHIAGEPQSLARRIGGLVAALPRC